MSSIGLGKPPVIYPTPLDNSSSFSRSPTLNRTTSSPLISRYSKRRIKKLGHKNVLSQKGNLRLAASNKTKREGVEKRAGDLEDEDEENPIYIKETEEYKLHLIRRIFLPKVSLDTNIKDYLPAMTSSSAVDIELYCFIGLLFKNFINEWYFKITENDEFISEVIDVVAHITRNLETRVRKINLNDMILDYIPYILDHHRQFYSYCLNNLDSQFIQYSSMEEAFDMMNNHPAMSMKFKQKPAHEEDYNLTFQETSFYNDSITDTMNLTEELNKLEEDYLAMLSKGALALLLPVDVSDSNLARYFVRSVMSNIVLKILTKQLSEPDIIYTILISAFKSLDKSKDSQKNLKVDDEQVPKTIKAKIINVFRTAGHIIAYSTSTGSSSQNNLTNQPIVNRYIFQFLNNLFNFAIENPILYIIMKYFSLWFLSYNIDEISHLKLFRKRSKSSSSNDSIPTNNSLQNTSNLLQNSLNTIINSHLFSIKINKILYNLFEKLVLQRFFKNDIFISSTIKMARNMIFPTDDKMGPPRKIPNQEELENMKIELFLLMKKNIPFWFKLFIFNEVGNEWILENINHHKSPDEYQSNKFRSLVKTKTDFKFYQFIESFKYQKFNRLLIYNLTDHLFIELFPEMKDLTPSVLEKHE